MRERKREREESYNLLYNYLFAGKREREYTFLSRKENALF
jgi:hypothetical protein